MFAGMACCISSSLKFRKESAANDGRVWYLRQQLINLPVGIITWLQCFKARDVNQAAFPSNYLAESKITQNTADTELALAYIVAKCDKRRSSS